MFVSAMKTTSPPRPPSPPLGPPFEMISHAETKRSRRRQPRIGLRAALHQRRDWSVSWRSPSRRKKAQKRLSRSRSNERGRVASSARSDRPAQITRYAGLAKPRRLSNAMTEVTYRSDRRMRALRIRCVCARRISSRRYAPWFGRATCRTEPCRLLARKVCSPGRVRHSGQDECECQLVARESSQRKPPRLRRPSCLAAGRCYRDHYVSCPVPFYATSGSLLSTAYCGRFLLATASSVCSLCFRVLDDRTSREFRRREFLCSPDDVPGFGDSLCVASS